MTWVAVDENIMGSSAMFERGLDSASGITKLGLAAMELLAGFLIRSNKLYSFSSLVVEFKVMEAMGAPREGSRRPGIIRNALTDLVSLIDHHYPQLVNKTYIVNPFNKYLACLDTPDYMLRNTVLLQSPRDLVLHLGPDVPAEYGGSAPSLQESDFLPSLKPSTELNDKSPNTKVHNQSMNEEEDSSAASDDRQSSNSESKEPRLLYSDNIGPPTIVLDPDDLATAEDLCKNKMGARVVYADAETVAKFGDGVRMAEAEAMHLVSTRTTIAAPKLLSAYVLDGIGYIVMSFEEGEPLERYWDRVSEAERENVVRQLCDYVRQMRDIKGDFIGGLDESPCRDGMFEGGFGNYRAYSYGPYGSEQSFNEGMVQALHDRLPPDLRSREGKDPESSFWASEHYLYQTVRALQGHEIVFTHGDLSPRNIIVRADGTVVLLDWGLAGFWPEYWEFYRALFSSTWRASWDRVVERFIGSYYLEDSVVKRVFGTVWN